MRLISGARHKAHARRKFHDFYQAHRSSIAKEALERIGRLYGFEQEIHGRSPADRREVRQARTRPLLEATDVWLKATLGKLSQKSDVAVAIRYALERWTALLPARTSALPQLVQQQDAFQTRAVSRSCTLEWNGSSLFGRGGRAHVGIPSGDAKYFRIVLR